MAGIAVVHEGFVMAASGAQRAGPTGVALGYFDMAPAQKRGLFFAIDASGDVAEACWSESTKRWQGDVARGSDADESSRRPDAV